jgi:hypothetical protein
MKRKAKSERLEPGRGAENDLRDERRHTKNEAQGRAATRKGPERLLVESTMVVSGLTGDKALFVCQPPLTGALGVGR